VIDFCPPAGYADHAMSEREGDGALKPVELQVETVAIDWRGYPVVKLREKGGQRAIFIWIGLAEASAISMQIEGQRPPRPMTHDLIVSLLSHFGIQVER